MAWGVGVEVEGRTENNMLISVFVSTYMCASKGGWRLVCSKAKLTLVFSSMNSEVARNLHPSSLPAFITSIYKRELNV